MTVAAAVAVVALAGREGKHGSYVDADKEFRRRVTMVAVAAAAAACHYRETSAAAAAAAAACHRREAVLLQLLLPRHATVARPVLL